MMGRQWHRAVFLLCLVLGGVGCTSGEPQIRIVSQEAVPSPVMRGVVSVFMKIENAGRGSDSLTGAKTDLPGTLVELHDTKNGKMIRTEKISLPAGSSVSLQPGGAHIMIFRMPREAGVGSVFSLRLVFGKSGEKNVAVKIIRPSDMRYDHES
ncbi:MAG: copper chaperone PCu(A)C [Alphaproteobacteria bacterium]|uniref:Copper chaperone PCu(A)C n=1 Tax=Candidatus Nitrobium versatile TaxID=2884831 RepID=A0A953LZM8_9BACT|nr:copper chaperone PCu(A)C [Candidatus Nitrobium versatile]